MMCLNFNEAVYTVLVSATECDIVLLPVRVLPCEKCANMITYSIMYSSAANNIKSKQICPHYMLVL